MGKPGSGKRSLVVSLRDAAVAMQKELSGTQKSGEERNAEQDGATLSCGGLGYTYFAPPFEESCKVNVWLIEDADGSEVSAL